MSALEILNCEFDCGDVTRGDGTDVHAMHAGNRAAEPAGPQSPFNKAVPPACEPADNVPAGAAAGCRISRAPLPPPSAAPEAVTPRAWAVSDTDDFGLLRSLPLVIPASLILWAVIAAAWIALK